MQETSQKYALQSVFLNLLDCSPIRRILTRQYKSENIVMNVLQAELKERKKYHVECNETTDFKTDSPF